MSRIALITGATAGIGEACAHQYAQNNYDLILTGRRQEKLNQLKSELEKHEIEVITLCFDVQSHASTLDALNSLPESWKAIDILINNAGLAAGLDPIHQGNLEHWERMIDTNVKGLLYVSRIVLPWMTERKKGHVVNIGSIAGKEVYANGNVYCASKHAVDALSKAMRLDLLPYGIKVTNIAPGLVETEFSMVRFDWDKEKAHQVYKGIDPLKAEDIADCAWFATSRPEHVVIGDMLVLPSAQGNSTTVRRE